MGMFSGFPERLADPAHYEDVGPVDNSSNLVGVFQGKGGDRLLFRQWKYTRCYHL